MKNDVLSLLGKLNNTPQHPNDNILIVDGLNIYIRAFAANGAVNDKGVPVGGLVGFLKSLNLLIRETNPTRVIITFDGKGGSLRRKNYTPIIKEKENQEKG